MLCVSGGIRALLVSAAIASAPWIAVAQQARSIDDAALKDAGRTGDEWIQLRSSLALFVPSAVLPAERNILVNPAHAEFSNIRVGQPEPHAFDQRLFRLPLS